MHLFYRERLQEAFCLERKADSSARPVPYDEPILLSMTSEELKRRRDRGTIRFPDLVICAAVAAGGHKAPHKARALSFTFEGQLSGNEESDLQIPTDQLESDRWLGGGSLTLPALMAISGAALSPLMGRFTLPAFRFLMAVLNIRLGVWIRNPHGVGRRGRRALPEQIDVWAQGAAGRGVLTRSIASVWLGWREPGPWYVLKEGLGRADITGRFMYVSDGGHWENLGLVELLRRGCSHVICVDASSSPMADLARATAIARRDLGAEVTVPISDSREDGTVSDPVSVGTVRYRDGTGGTICVARCALWDGAPGDLRILAESGASAFPHHPTSKQFLSGEDFEAYRALGWAIGERVLGEAALPPSAFDEESLVDSDVPTRRRRIVR